MEKLSVASLLLLLAAPLVGAVLALFFRQQSEKNYAVVLSFSGAFLFAVVVLELFPSVFRELPHAGYFVLAGFFLQIILEQLTRGMEHGHVHAHHMGTARVTALLAGLMVHSLLDGIPLARHELTSDSHRHLLYAISLHKLPEGFALASLLLISGFRTTTAMAMAFLLAIAAPLAVVAGTWLGSQHQQILLTLIAIALGSFLHVTTTVLFESEHPTHVVSRRRLLAIVAGAALALIL